MLLALGLGWTEIARALPESARLSAVNVREHALRDHQGVRGEVANRLIAEAGGDVDAVLEAGVEQAIRRLVRATKTLNTVREEARLGLAQPTLAQGMRAARLLLDQEAAVREAQGLTHQVVEIEQDLQSMLGLVKATVVPEVWSTIVAALDRDARVRVHLL